MTCPNICICKYLKITKNFEKYFQGYFHSTKKNIIVLYFLNIFQNNFYMVIKRGSNGKDTIFYQYATCHNLC